MRFKFTQSAFIIIIGLALMGALTVGLQIAVDESPLANVDQGVTLTYADALARVTPAVVSVHPAEWVEESEEYDAITDFLRRYYGLSEPAEQEDALQIPLAVGSGFIVSADGYIITNHHVLSGYHDFLADIVTVVMKDGREYTAKIVGTDPLTDVAVLKIDEKELTYLTFADSDQARVGDVVFAVGYPLNIGITVTSGIVSALGRSELRLIGMGAFENFIQTDTPINVGNSGGPLVDARGRLLGMNTAILSRTGGSMGLGFAVPANVVRRTAESIISSGRVMRGYLGVQIGPVSKQLVEQYGLLSSRGALVTGVVPQSPAMEAGLRVGDIITTIDGLAVQNSSDLRFKISQFPPISDVRIGCIREGMPIELKATLRERP